MTIPNKRSFLVRKFSGHSTPETEGHMVTSGKQNIKNSYLFPHSGSLYAIEIFKPRAS